MRHGDAVRVLALVGVAGVLAAALAHAQESAPASAAVCSAALGVTSLQPVSCGSLARAHVIGNVILASQPSPADIEALRAAGIRTVINLRAASEINWDEGAQVRGLGMQYLNPGFSTPDQLTDSIFDSVREALRSNRDQQVLLHCASANRVGAAWLAHRVLDGGLDYPTALEEAQTVGLRSPELEARAREYIARQSR
jgi:protein tyrosine phosphatase (PTP) superfamily phosphohydrolase (DUF442 family)